MRNFQKSICTFLCGAMLCGCVGNGGMETSSQSSASLQNSIADSHGADAMASEDELNHLYSFSWNLFNQVREDKEGGLVSPLSALFALGMAANGANGETLNQMEKALNLSVDQINALSRSALHSAAEDETRTLEIANSIWVNQKYTNSLIDSYSRLLKSEYDAQDFVLDFSPDQGQEQIDQWVAKKTHNMIDKMPAHLSSDTVMVLINALAFNSAWAQAYEAGDISRGPFTNVDGSTSQVEFLNSTEKELVAAEGFKGFIKPYESRRYGLAVLVPEEDRPLDEVLAEADGAKLLNALRTPQSATVHASFPEYTFASEMLLNEALEAMGMELPFSEKADFSKMVEGGNVAISEVLQKAKIEVSRSGTKAAAVTEVIVNETAAMESPDEVNIVCDRPFLYLLMDLDTATPVFMGTIQSMEPSTQEN